MRNLFFIFIGFFWCGTTIADAPRCHYEVYYQIHYLDHHQQSRSANVILWKGLDNSNTYRRLPLPNGGEVVTQLSLEERITLLLIEQEANSKGWPILHDVYELQAKEVDTDLLPRFAISNIVFQTPTADHLNYQEVYQILNAEKLIDRNCHSQIPESIHEMAAILDSRATIARLSKEYVLEEDENGVSTVPISYGGLYFPGLSHPISIGFRLGGEDY